MTAVVVLGPNLIDDSLGSFHVHAAGCKHINTYYGRQFDDDKRNVLDMNSVEEIAEYVYDYEEDPTEYVNDFYVAPCVHFKEKEVSPMTVVIQFEVYTEDFWLDVQVETSEPETTLAALMALPNTRNFVEKVRVPGTNVLAFR